MTNAEFADRLEALAKVYRENPDMAQPYTAETSWIVFAMDKKSAAATLRAFGAGTKEDEKDFIGYRPANWQDMRIKVKVYKYTVCERVVTGTRKTPGIVIPAAPAHGEVVIPGREEPVVEWRCGSILEPEAPNA
jgi:hypothetical protein